MKSKKLTLLCSIGMILVLVLSTILAACAQEAAPAAPAAPAKPAPTTPTTPTTPATPATPAKPAPAPAAEVFNWTFTSAWPAAGAIHNVCFVHLADQIEEATGGRISFKIFSGGELFPAAESFEAVGEGAVEMCATDGSYARGKFPVGAIDSGLPVLYEDMRDIFYTHEISGVTDILRREYAKNNIYYLGVATSAGGGSGLMTVDPVRTLDDFKGVTIRTYGAYLDFFKELGMGTVYIPHDEVYMALKLGTVQGYCTGRGQQWDYRGHEVCNYYYVPGLGTAGGSALVNMDAYNKLSEDLQREMEVAMQAHNGWMLYGYDPICVDQAMTWFDNYGLERIAWGSDVLNAMDAAAKSIWDDFAAESDACKEVMDLTLDYLAQKKAGEIPCGE